MCRRVTTRVQSNHDILSLHSRDTSNGSFCCPRLNTHALLGIFFQRIFDREAGVRLAKLSNRYAFNEQLVDLLERLAAALGYAEIGKKNA